MSLSAPNVLKKNFIDCPKLVFQPRIFGYIQDTFRNEVQKMSFKSPTRSSSNVIATIDDREGLMRPSSLPNKWLYNTTPAPD